MTEINDRIKEKLIAQGWSRGWDSEMVPPPGMGGFTAAEVLERVRREAEGEAAETQATRTDEPRTGIGTRLSKSNYDPHWHEHNPWNDHILYVPIEELAACHMSIGQPYARNGDEILIYIKEMVLDQWHQHGGKLDAYILTGYNVPMMTAGVRFGPDGPDYLSPGFSLPKLRALMLKYGSQDRKSA